MSTVSHTAARSMGEAATAAARLLEHCITEAVAALQASEAQAMAEQRQKVGDAWRAMLARRPAWVARFPGRLQAAFDADIAGGGRADAAATESASGDFLSLALVDDTEIARNIESTRLAQQLGAMLERPLAELDPLMSSALGLDGIQPQRNPLRPGIYAQVLRQVMEDDSERPEPGWTALWLRAMVQPLAKALEQLYRAQAALLTEAQVHAADYKVLAAPGKPISGAPRQATQFAGPATFVAGTVQATAAAGVEASVVSATAAATASAALPATRSEPAAAALRQTTDGERLQRFLSGDEPDAHQVLADDFHAQAEAELRALQERVDERRHDAQAARQHMHLPVVDRPARPVDTDSPLPEEAWGAYSAPRERALVRGRLKVEARELGQVLGLEVVRRLLDQVADDPRLLAPVREALVALEPSLARLAMVAPRFFSDEAHPGRLLVERVAQRSFRYNDEFGAEFQAFLEPVAQTFGRLNQIEQFRNATAFQAALAALQAEWSARDAQEQDAQRKVLEAVQFAERRQQEAQRLAATLRERDDLQDAPPEVQEFVLGTWTLVVAQARLTHAQGGEDPDARLALLRDLLWSVNTNLTLHEPARAFALIPRVLLQLREGLAALGQQPPESEAFFHALEKLHRPVLKLLARHRQRDLAPPEPPTRPQPVAAARPPEQPWMTVEDLHAAGFEDTQQPTPAPAQALAESMAADMVAALEPGCWVDLYAHQQWRRAKLAWTTDKGSLFLFVSDGGRPHSMTRRSLQRLVQQRLLRPVEGEGVVPRALQRLGQAAGVPA